MTVHISLCPLIFFLMSKTTAKWFWMMWHACWPLSLCQKTKPLKTALGLEAARAPVEYTANSGEVRSSPPPPPPPTPDHSFNMVLNVGIAAAASWIGHCSGEHLRLLLFSGQLEQVENITWVGWGRNCLKNEQNKKSPPKRGLPQNVCVVHFLVEWAICLFFRNVTHNSEVCSCRVYAQYTVFVIRGSVCLGLRAIRRQYQNTFILLIWPRWSTVRDKPMACSPPPPPMSHAPPPILSCVMKVWSGCVFGVELPGGFCCCCMKGRRVC